MNEQAAEFQFLEMAFLGRLLDALRANGYQCHAPVMEQHAIVFREVLSVDEMPRGMQARQSPARYELGRDSRNRYFAWANGPQAIKPFSFAPQESLWRVERDQSGALAFAAIVPQPVKTALIGVRACDLAALALQDAHFLQGQHADAAYAARRGALFLVAVQCAEPAATCFCASTGDGPSPRDGFDLSLAELEEGFLITAGSEAGKQVLSALGLPEATPGQIEDAKDQAQTAAQMQSRALPGRDLRALLMERLEHARWDEVAGRCLSCGNCTAVCPTCFCHAHADEPNAATGESLHFRQWDSCFNEGHAYIHGHNVRPDTRSRYRQWLTHKLAGWHDQYGRSGCVGCGRCIAWCPAGIDLTEEVAMLATDA